MMWLLLRNRWLVTWWAMVLYAMWWVWVAR